MSRKSSHAGGNAESTATDRRESSGSKPGRPSGLHLDETDRLLIAALAEDGRASLGDLGKQVGLSGDAVRERLNRMRRERIIQVVGATDPRAAGLNSHAIVGLRVNGPVQHAAQALIEVPEIDFVAASLGSFDLILELLCPDDLALADVVDSRIRTRLEIASCVVFKRLEVAKWSPGSMAHRSSPMTELQLMDLDEADRTLMHALQEDGRATFKELARRTGLAYPQARRRTQRLLNTGVVRIETTVNPLVDDRVIVAMVGVRLSGPAHDAVKAIAGLDDVEIAMITSGPFDLLLEVVCEDEAGLAGLLGESLRSMPDVARSEAFIYTHILKLPVSWEL